MTKLNLGFGFTGVMVVALFVGVFLWADSLEKNKTEDKYHRCMFLVRQMIPVADPLDRNELCQIIVR